MTGGYPRWVDADLDGMNLREVAPGLYVGSVTAPLRGGWDTIIDLYGKSTPKIEAAQRAAGTLLRLPFLDGDPFPPGVLGDIWLAWQQADVRGGDTLIHCQGGLSRSPSAAYAMLRMRYGLPHASAMARVIVPSMAQYYPLAGTLNSAVEWVRRNGNVA